MTPSTWPCERLHVACASRGSFATRSFHTGPGTRETSKRPASVDGMLERLEGELAGLDLCKKSLADFLDGRRRQFPRLLLREADLLDILSNGSVPEKVMVHTSKIVSTKVLTLVRGRRTASNRPIAIGFVAGVGEEYVPFEPAVPLEGKVEIYMQTVLDAMKITLYENLKSVVRYAQMERKRGSCSRRVLTQCVELQLEAVDGVASRHALQGHVS